MQMRIEYEVFDLRELYEDVVGLPMQNVYRLMLERRRESRNLGGLGNGG
jgi:hypothetical protein